VDSAPAPVVELERERQATHHSRVNNLQEQLRRIEALRG
jgi:hypothetical protein